MNGKKRVHRFVAPIVAIVLGTLFIVTKSASHGLYWQVDGPIAVFGGVMFCLFGIWGIIITIQEDRKKDQ